MSKDDREEPTTAAGVAVVGTVGLGVLAGAWAAAPHIALLVFWAAGAGSVWWAVSRPAKIDNPSPPPPSTPTGNTKRQFTAVPDTVNPHRTHVVWDDERTTT